MMRRRERINRSDKRAASRRGATLVLVAIMLSVIMGLAAMAVDLSRMYSFKSDLKSLADAAALSVSLDQRIGLSEAQAEANAFLLRSANKVDGGNTATMTASDITPVSWNFNTKVATSATWATANAAQVVVSYTANWTLARVFGANTKTLSDTSIAAFGSDTTSSCLKPMAMPYGAVLQKLGKSTPYDMNYVLTRADIDALDNSTTPTKLFDANSSPGGTPGFFGWIDVNTTNVGNKNQEIAAAITGCVSRGLGVGSDIEVFTGNRSNKTIADAMDALCGGSSICDAAKPPFFVSIYSSTAGTGSNATVRVKYIGAFKLTRQDSDGLWGYLTSVNSPPIGGQLSNAPGPVTSSALVK